MLPENGTPVFVSHRHATADRRICYKRQVDFGRLAKIRKAFLAGAITHYNLQVLEPV